jgi:hypothetical protein
MRKAESRKIRLDHLKMKLGITLRMLAIDLPLLRLPRRNLRVVLTPNFRLKETNEFKSEVA